MNAAEESEPLQTCQMHPHVFNSRLTYFTFTHSNCQIRAGLQILVSKVMESPLLCLSENSLSLFQLIRHFVLKRKNALFNKSLVKLAAIQEVKCQLRFYFKAAENIPRDSTDIQTLWPLSHCKCLFFFFFLTSAASILIRCIQCFKPVIQKYLFTYSRYNILGHIQKQGLQLLFNLSQSFVQTSFLYFLKLELKKKKKKSTSFLTLS